MNTSITWGIEAGLISFPVKISHPRTEYPERIRKGTLSPDQMKIRRAQLRRIRYRKEMGIPLDAPLDERQSNRARRMIP